MPQFDYLFTFQLVILFQKECTIMLTCIVTVPVGLIARPLPEKSETIEWHNGGAVDTPRTAFVAAKRTVRKLHTKNTTKMLIVVYIGGLDTEFSQKWRKLPTCLAHVVLSIHYTTENDWRHVYAGHNMATTTPHHILYSLWPSRLLRHLQNNVWSDFGNQQGGEGSDVRNKTSSIVTMATQCDSFIHWVTIIFYVRRYIWRLCCLASW